MTSTLNVIQRHLTALLTTSLFAAASLAQANADVVMFQNTGSIGQTGNFTTNPIIIPIGQPPVFPNVTFTPNPADATPAPSTDRETFLAKSKLAKAKTFTTVLPKHDTASRVKISSTGKFSGYLRTIAGRNSFKGKFDTNGHAQVRIGSKITATTLYLQMQSRGDIPVIGFTLSTLGLAEVKGEFSAP